MPEYAVPTTYGTRVSVRLLHPGDREVFVAGVAASDDLHVPWVSPPRGPEAYDAAIAGVGPCFVPLGVFRIGDGALLGVVSISQIVLGTFCSAYLGYYAFAPHAKQGYMHDGLDLALQLAFEHLGLNRLEANIQPENTRSIALVRRLGFECEGFSPKYLRIAGVWRDHERWAIRREIWTARQAR